MVQPYPCKSGYLYIPCKRGDGILAHNKPKQIRLFDGMCGGYIDPDDWQTPPVLSPYTQGETLWIEIPKTKKNKEWAIAAGKPENEPAPEQSLPANYRRMTNWIDFKVLAPYVESQCPDFLNKVWKHKLQIPVIKLSKIDASCIKDAQDIDPHRALIPDVGQITAGNYTVGPAAGDNYPTFGGAGGGYAALGNLTGDLTFRLTGNITETAAAQVTENLGGFTLLNTSSNPHYGDPTAGWLMQINFQGIFFDLQEEDTVGNGPFEIEHLYLRRIPAYGGLNIFIYINTITNAHNITIHDLLLDGNGARERVGVQVADNTPTCHFYNLMIWDYQNLGAIYTNAINGNSLIENCAAYNGTSGADGIDIVNQAPTVRNCTSYGNAGNDFQGIGAATGRYNVSSDGSAANGNWTAGVGNEINHVVANDVQSVNDAQATFFDIVVSGPLDGNGEANGIAARTTCIRNRAVPGPSGTSMGPAESAASSSSISSSSQSSASSRSSSSNSSTSSASESSYSRDEINDLDTGIVCGAGAGVGFPIHS